MTSNLFEKHIECINAAKLLQKSNYYSSTVNRSYYGCFLFLLDTLYTKLKVNPDEFESQRRQNKEGTHGWASKLIEIELAKLDREDFKWYQKNFPEFQKLRIKADYSKEMISQEESLNSINTATSIINCVSKYIK